MPAKRSTTRVGYAKRLLERAVWEGGCFVWKGACAHKGHGLIGWTGKSMCYTHRISYWVWVGVIPPGMCVLHKCDNPPCINPDHLFLGTNQDNIADRQRKGRQAKGAQIHTCKLCPNDVVDIRNRIAVGESMRSVGRFYLVRHSTISNIIRGITWAHHY